MIPFSIQREALPTQTQVRKPTRALTAEGRAGRAEPLPWQLPNSPPGAPRRTTPRPAALHGFLASLIFMVLRRRPGSPAGRGGRGAALGLALLPLA